MEIEWNLWDERTGVRNHLSELVGETISFVNGSEIGSDEVVILTASGKAIKIHHEPDCCETVLVEDVDCDDIVGGLVISADLVDGESPSLDDDYHDSYTWTFVKIDTSKGYLWMRWLGESNGYYSESPAITGGRLLVNG